MQATIKYDHGFLQATLLFGLAGRSTIMDSCKRELLFGLAGKRTIMDSCKRELFWQGFTIPSQNPINDVVHFHFIVFNDHRFSIINNTDICYSRSLLCFNSNPMDRRSSICCSPAMLLPHLQNIVRRHSKESAAAFCNCN